MTPGIQHWYSMPLQLLEKYLTMCGVMGADASDSS
jgi:hypothetical protein